MKKILSLVLIVVLILSLASCSANKKELQPLKIGVLPDVDSIPVIIAEQNGYFDKENVKIDIQQFKSAKDRDAALQTGNIDGAISDILAAAFASDGGFSVKITSKTDGNYKLLVNKDANIKTLADLNGKGVAMSKNTIIEYTTDMMLKEAGLSGDDIDKVAIPDIPTRLEMLQNGKVASATLPDPLASVAMGNGAILLNSTDKLGINPGVIIFTDSAVNSKADEIKAFYKAYNKAVDYLKTEDRSKYINSLIEKAGFPPQVKDTIVLPSYNKAIAPAQDDLDNVIEWLISKNLIKTKYEYKDLVNTKFVE